MELGWFLGSCIFLGVYWAGLRSSQRPYALLVAALGVLGWLQPIHTLVLVVYCWIIHQVGVRLREDPEGHRRLGQTLVLATASLLLLAKYGFAPLTEGLRALGFHLTLLVPLGISYFSFRIIHYLIECARKTFKPHSYTDFLLYITFLPTFFAGPIERFEAFYDNRPVSFEANHIWGGGRRIAIGVFKKTVIADFMFAELWGARPLTNLPPFEDIPAGIIWMRLALYYLYCYLDFSALSDIAIGASRLVGYKIGENFNWPIVARDMGEFWQRWHMSLSNFCKYYIYLFILGRTRNYFYAYVATMLTIGLWHDLTINWTLWAVYHAVGLYAVVRLKKWLKKRKKLKRYYESTAATPLRVLATFAFVTFGYSFVGTDSPIKALRVMMMAWGF